jgi:hypothetical protein
VAQLTVGGDFRAGPAGLQGIEEKEAVERPKGTVQALPISQYERPITSKAMHRIA